MEGHVRSNNSEHKNPHFDNEGDILTNSENYSAIVSDLEL